MNKETYYIDRWCDVECVYKYITFRWSYAGRYPTWTVKKDEAATFDTLEEARMWFGRVNANPPMDFHTHSLSRVNNIGLVSWS